jgi:hypothetical protein
MMDANQHSVHSISALLKHSTDTDSDTNSDSRSPTVTPVKQKSSLKHSQSIDKQLQYANGESLDDRSEDDTILPRNNVNSMNDVASKENNLLQLRAAAVAYRRQISKEPVEHGGNSTSNRKVHFSGETEEIKLELELGNVPTDNGPASPKV